jgi:glycosyltransferase involved in cell wall biosynthesis
MASGRVTIFCGMKLQIACISRYLSFQNNDGGTKNTADMDQTSGNRQAIAAVIITHNVADKIERTVRALLPVCEEVLVLDTDSDDGTVAICRQLGARVVSTDWLGFAGTKNLGNSLAGHGWILSVDADEVLSAELAAELSGLRPERGKVYALDRITRLGDRWIRHSGWYPDWKIRLFHRDDARWEGDFVHERLVVRAGTNVVRLPGRLWHYSYRDKADHLARMEKYAGLAAREMYAKGKKSRWWLRYLSPLVRFLRTYFLKAGFLDGRAGFQISIRNAYMIHRRYELLERLWTASARDSSSEGS